MRKEGRSVHTSKLKVVVRPSNASRLGLVVSKRVSKRAVDRNRVKRCLRESYRRNAQLFPNNTDVLLIAKPSALNANVSDFVHELTEVKHLMQRALDRSKAFEGAR